MPRTPLKVLLVNPKAFDDQKPTKGMAFFPFSIVYIVHYLKAEDICEVDFVDLVMTDQQDLFDELANTHFDLVGITALAANRFMAISLAEDIRKISPDTRIVFGGQFFGAFPEETLAKVPEADFVVTGEGEYTLSELVLALADGTPLEEVKGLSFRRGGEVVRNPRRRAEMSFKRFSETSR